MAQTDQQGVKRDVIFDPPVPEQEPCADAATWGGCVSRQGTLASWMARPDTLAQSTRPLVRPIHP